MAPARSPATVAVAPQPVGAATSAPDSPVPILADDATWGDATAPVTIVEFSDLECPFCARVQPTLATLQAHYGPEQLRIVFKHDPLPFHPHAAPAARAARAVMDLAGPSAFFGFVGALFGDQSHLDAEDLERVAAAYGVAPAALEARAQSPEVVARVDADVTLANRLGIDGTPGFLINGIPISGAVPAIEFTGPIERELAEGRLLVANGMKPADVYSARTKRNYQAPEAADAPDTTVWNVPVGDSPVLGPRDALVTVIEFSDFQCPFCKRVQPTLAALEQKYGADLRVVFKHLPLPFHDRSRPAATLAIEARKKLGDAGFWRAVDLIYASEPRLGESDLERIAVGLHLDWPTVRTAIAGDLDAPVIDADMRVAQAFGAAGTPHFFINGRRLVGAQPAEAFAEIIDASLAEARALVNTGTVARDRVFDELMRRATTPP